MSEPTRRVRATMKDVAARAGVSHQTVSRFFRAPDGLKPLTRERVEEAAAALSYRPNSVARSMRTKRTGRIAVVVPPIAFSPARMLAGATAAAHAAGYSVDVLSPEGGADERTDRVLELADAHQVDGIASFAPLVRGVSRPGGGTPLVLAGELDDKMRGIGELTDASAVPTLVQGLRDHGHRHLLHVTGSLQFASARARRDAFVETCRALGLQGDVCEGDWSAESGHRAAAALSTGRRATAVVAGNDLVAAGVIRGAADRGWRVPHDLSVTGWDDQPLGRHLLPSLTTVSIDLEGIGARVVERLLRVLRGGPDERLPAEATTRVVWRESTGPAPTVG
ncbi:LacI family DNA-binding transcriptional regulator [Microbacterium sp. G2-8]|uniref:LacI family DNA-binding transcriptional regulator n=1 Tax=Microbacterium sp. G2-8 TaxID=2842454 RepID=UPI001C89FFED|nr:LacI family DNA-binding transcriptional regulator [Microbacterium sp. G2-8]